MANILSAVRDRFYVVQDTAVPACTKVFNVSTANRRDWEIEIENSKLAPPWGVCVWGDPREADWGLANRAYEMEIIFIYITSTKAAGGGNKTDRTILTEVEDASNALITAMRAETGATSVFTTLEDGFDATETNEANAVFLNGNKDYYGSVTRFLIMFGETP